MKVVFNTRYPDTPASAFYISAFKRDGVFAFFDWNNYQAYDAALFMTYQQDLNDLVRAKKANPLLMTGLIDPRGSFVKRYARYIDFFVVDSIEMKDFFAGYRKPIYTYPEYPDILPIKRKHWNKDKIIIGYHGNRVHLEGMFPNITRALELIGREYRIEFWAVYNVKQLGSARAGVPKNVNVRHIQWTETVYHDELSKVDIGIVPALMPIRNLSKLKKKSSVFKGFFNDNDDDYLIKFKMPSNPGRIIVFGLLGIPVVTDFFPSALQFVKEGRNGLLAYSSGGWYTALEKLIKNAGLRQDLSDEMLRFIIKHLVYEVQNEKLKAFIKDIVSNPSPEKELIPVSNQSLEKNKDFWIGIAENYFRRIRRAMNQI